VIAGDVSEVERLCRLINPGPGGLIDEPEPDSSTAEHAFFFDIKGQSALHLSATYGHEAIVKILLDRGASLLLDNYGRQPAHLAAENGHLGCLKLLLSSVASRKGGVNGNTNTNAQTHMSSNSSEASSVQSDKGGLIVDPNIRERVCGKTLLHLSAAAGHVEQVRLLLSMEGIKVNKQEMTGCTALHYACAEGHVDCVALLLDNVEIDVSLREFVFGQTALHKACAEGYPNCVDLLLRRSSCAADVDVVDEEFGRSCLHWAALGNSIEHLSCLQLLLSAERVVPADVSKEDAYGRTALIYACISGSIEAVKLLMKAGSPANHRDRDGMAALLHAAQAGHHQVLIFLLNTPSVDLDIENLDGDTVWTLPQRDTDVRNILFENLR